MDIVQYFVKDKLQCFIYENRKKMGKAAARDIIATIHLLLAQKDSINVMFAAAPSQNDVLDALASDTSLDWSRIHAFHMDEYVGLPVDAPQRFGNFLKDHIWEKKNFASVNYIKADTITLEEEISRYENILKEHPIDICLMGVGENGHIAFNDPPVADFKDPHLVKTVKLDSVCRQQQVNDGCFSSLDRVPEYALTVTVPGLLKASAVFCIVPAYTKANAIAKLIHGEITTECPSSILRTHNCVRLYLDSDAASKL